MFASADGKKLQAGELDLLLKLDVALAFKDAPCKLRYKLRTSDRTPDLILVRPRDAAAEG